METIRLSNKHQLIHAIKLVEELPLNGSYEVIIQEYVEPRTLAQNRLQFKWYQEAAAQNPQDDAKGYRAYCKLHIGIPILRAENEGFREKYDRVIMPLSYQQKLELMVEPFDFPVTRLMRKKQKAKFLDQVFEHLTSLGIKLTEPE